MLGLIVRSAMFFVGACAAADTSAAAIRTDHISRGGFEPVPLQTTLRIEFIGDRSLLFTAAGQERRISLRVRDSAGHEVPLSGVAWELIPAGSASITPVTAEGSSAVVTSLSSWTDPVRILARTPYGDAHGEAVFATLADEAVWLPSSDVHAILGDRTSAHLVELSRTPVTESLHPGNILVSGDQAGLLARVTSVELRDSSVALGVAPALLTEAYENVAFSALGDPLVVNIGGGPKAASGNSIWLVDPAVECEGNLETPASDGAPVRVSTTLIPEGDLRIEDFALSEFRLELRGGLGVEADMATEGSTQGTSHRRCTLDVIKIAPVSIRLGPIAVSPTIDIGGGVEFSLDRGADVLSVTVNRLQRHWVLRGGVRFDPAAGWQPINERNSPELRPETRVESGGGGVTMNAEAFMQVSANLSFSLGSPRLGANLADLKFFELNAGPYYRAELRPPLPVTEFDYIGPFEEAGVHGSAFVTVQARFFDGALSAFFPQLRVDSGIRETLFDVRRPFYASPPVGGFITCARACNALEAGIDSITVTASADTEEAGNVAFLLGRSDDLELREFATTGFSNHVGRTTWLLPESVAPGIYGVFARLSLGGLTETFPLAPDGPVAWFCVPDLTGEIDCGSVSPDPCEVSDSCNPGGGYQPPPADVHPDPRLQVTLQSTRGPIVELPNPITVVWMATGNAVQQCRPESGSSGRLSAWMENSILAPSGSLAMMTSTPGVYRLWLRCFSFDGSRLSNEVVIEVR